MTNSVRRHWQLIFLLIFIGLQLVAVVEGVVLFSIGNFFLFSGDTLYISVHAIVMLIYKILQKRFAYLHNRKKMSDKRNIYAEALITEFPHFETEIRNIAARFTTFDKFLNDLVVETDITQPEIDRILPNIFPDGGPQVSIVAPIYDLKEHELRDMLESLANQVYKKLAFVYLIVNDATDIRTVEFLNNLIRERYSHLTTRFLVEIEPIPGKRHAQKRGFKYALRDGSKYIINMDGDGFIHPYTLLNSIVAMEVSEQEAIENGTLPIGLLSGDVRISNWKTNWLTKVTGIRYMIAGWEERASQSYFGEMICGSGPWLVMRREALEAVLTIWSNFKVRGKVEANFGDDRQLTLEIMKMGWRTEFDPDSIVWTDCPTKIRSYWRQQVRWNKSSWIYNIYMYETGDWAKLTFFVRFSVAYLMFYPFVVITALLRVFAGVLVALIAGNVLLAWAIAEPYVISVVIVSVFFQSLSGILLFHDFTFLWAPSYLFLWFGVQIPARPWSFITMMDQGWGTRKDRTVEEIPLE